MGISFKKYFIEVLKSKTALLYILAILISIASFGAIYGFKILNPTYDAWLFAGGDLTQHYVGWEAYRNSPWTFPIGNFNTLTYPTNVSIVFTDSIPLFAVFFKILSPILPETFQYWGLFGLLSYIAIGITAATIIRKYSNNILYILLGSEFFLISPFIFFRMYGHEALGGGQWLILLSFLALIYYEEYFFEWKKASIFWGGVAALCVMIHIYFAAMALMVLFGFCFYDYIKQKKVGRSFLILTSFFVSLLLTTFILGGFSPGSSFSASGLGVYSTNLNSLFNPSGYSKMLLSLPQGSGQSEGFGYLGVGMLLLAFLGMVLCTLRLLPKESINKWKIVAFSLSAIIAFAYALSPTVTFGNTVLFAIPLPDIIIKILSIFRASGRFIWVVAYLIYLIGMIALASMKHNNIKEGSLCFVLGCLLFIQAYDFSNVIEGKHSNYTTDVTYENIFINDETFQSIMTKTPIHHFSIVASDFMTTNYEYMYAIADYAIHNDLTIDRFYTAGDRGQEQRNIQIEKALKNISNDTLFLFGKSELSLCRKYGLYVYALSNGFFAGYCDKIETLEAKTLDEYDNNRRLAFIDLKDAWMNNGEDNLQDGKRYIFSGGISFGPYAYLEAGNYHITITGTNLDECSFASHSDQGNTPRSITDISQSNNKVEYNISLPEDVYDIEFLVLNQGNTTVALEELFIEKITSVIEE